jgi:hypothetical protein
VNKLVDDPLVAGGVVSAGAFVGVLDGDKGGLANLVGGGGNQVEPGRILGALLWKVTSLVSFVI